MNLSVVVPTIRGREPLLERTLNGFRQTVPADLLQLIVVRDRPCIGQAWTDGARAATGDMLLLAADDVIPAPGWLEAVTDAVMRGVVPSPRVLNPDGSLHSCGSMGGGMLLPDCPTGTPCATSPFPVLMRHDWQRIGPCIPAHYYADDYVSWMATRHGLAVEVVAEYELLHLEGAPGQSRMVARSQADRQAYLAAYAAAAREDQEDPA